LASAGHIEDQGLNIAQARHHRPGEFEVEIVGTDQVVRVDKQKATSGTVKEITG
jgi:hypothetical protein